MPLHAIEIDPADTYYSIRHRLLSSTSPPNYELTQEQRRVALLVPPSDDRSAAPLDPVTLILIRRLADRERLEIGLVTTDEDLAHQARSLGLPAFSNLTLATHFQPGWWRGRRTAHTLGFPDGSDFRLPNAAPIPSSAGINALRLLIICLCILLVIGLLALITSCTMSATVRFRPQPITTQIALNFNPNQATLTAAGMSVPTRRITLIQPWEMTVKSTHLTPDERRQVQALAKEGLAAAAPQLLASSLESNEILISPSITIETLDQAFHQSDVAIILTMRARLEALAVREDDLLALATREFHDRSAFAYSADRSHLNLQLESTTTQTEPSTMIVSAITSADIDRVELASLLRGQRATDAARYLATTYHSAEPPVIDVWPSWGLIRGRLPFWADRIHLELLP